MNKTAHRQVDELVSQWNATHPPEHRAVLRYDDVSHNYVLSVTSSDAIKSLDVLEPLGEQPLSGADQLRIIRDLESLL
jgi:hypothetical protein